MTTPVRSKSVQSERAVVVGVLLHAPVDAHGPLDEIRGLAESAGAEVVAELTQRRESPDQTTYLGKGKVTELSGLVAHHDAADVRQEGRPDPPPPPCRGGPSFRVGSPASPAAPPAAWLPPPPP